MGINAHLLTGEAGYRRAGIHQYIFQSICHLPASDDMTEHVVFTRHGDELRQRRPDLEQVSSLWPTERRLARIAWEQVAWPLTAASRRLDLLHSMAFVTPVVSPCPTVVTVYDLSFMHYPESFPASQRWYLTSQTERSCRQAARVIAISESGRQDIHRFFGVPLDHIDVVRPGVDSVYQPAAAAELEAFRRRNHINGRFVLHVGTLQPRKNLNLLIEAFARINMPDLKLCLVGGKGWLFESLFRRVAELGLEDRVVFTGYVPDSDLRMWYSAADLFVFPSLYEGFGMPVVEAMACGAPVVAAGTSSIPEVAGDAALLFDPADASELADRMAAVLNDVPLSNKMRENGYNQARRFTWTDAGRSLGAVYQRVLDNT